MARCGDRLYALAAAVQRTRAVPAGRDQRRGLCRGRARARRRRVPGPGARVPRLLPRRRHPGALRERLHLRSGMPAKRRSHAWVDAWIERVAGHGSGSMSRISSLPGLHHCRLAVGRDYLDAAPVRGVRRGGGREVMASASLLRSSTSARQSHTGDPINDLLRGHAAGHGPGVPVRLPHQRRCRSDQHLPQDHGVPEAAASACSCCRARATSRSRRR